MKEFEMIRSAKTRRIPALERAISGPLLSPRPLILVFCLNFYCTTNIHLLFIEPIICLLGLKIKHYLNFIILRDRYSMFVTDSSVHLSMLTYMNRVRPFIRK